VSGDVDARERLGRATGRGLLAGIALPAVAWAVQFDAAYVLVYHACSARSRAALYVVSAATLAACALGGLLAWREWRRIDDRPAQETGLAGIEGGRFLALLGVLCALSFALLIAGNLVPIVMLDPCD
jgi:hypothetical protein